MRKLSLAVVVALVAVGGVFVPSLVARQQGAAQFVYLVAAPYSTFQEEGRSMRSRPAYQACVAQGEQWQCREFESPRNPPDERDRIGDDALRAMLAALGSEGWELVSVTDTTPDASSLGMTYLFKRQQ